MLICAEAVPWRCHRSLIADALLIRGIVAREITSGIRTRLHTLTPFAHVQGTRLRDLVALSVMHLPEITTPFLRAVGMPPSDQRLFFRTLYPLLPVSDAAEGCAHRWRRGHSLTGPHADPSGSRRAE